MLTDPVLPNVPSTLGEPNKVAPARIEDRTGSPDLENGAGGTSSRLAPEEKDQSRTVGPELRNRFSVLFTEQRPFLLYAQDASITYLMPNALIDRPALGRYLRGILEERALSHWQEVRNTVPQDSSSELPKSHERPVVTISGRIEDRFASDAYSSLYLKETRQTKAGEGSAQILSFNFSHTDAKAFGLEDLFNSSQRNIFNSTISLIGAYIQTDIVRQKTVRLGTNFSLEQDSWLNKLEPTPDLFSNFTLVPSQLPGKAAGLAFQFNPGLSGCGRRWPL